MNKNSTCCLAVSLFVPALLVIWIHSDRRSASHSVAPSRSVSISRNAMTAGLGSTLVMRENIEQSALRFTAKMGDWENARYPESDKIEEELKALITDKNAAAIARALPSKYQGSYLGLLAQERWAGMDRKSAVKWLEEQSDPTSFQLDTMIKGWIVENPEDMDRHLASLPAGGWKDRLLGAIAKDAIAQDYPEQAFNLANGLSPGDEQTRLLATAVLKWSEWDAKGAIEQIDKLADPALQEKLIPHVGIGYAIAEPAQAADWIMKSLSPGELLDQGIGSVIQLWASQHNPSEAAAWVEKLPEGSTREMTTRKLIATWNEYNPGAVKRWIDQLPEGSFRTHATDELTKISSMP